MSIIFLNYNLELGPTKFEGIEIGDIVCNTI